MQKLTYQNSDPQDFSGILDELRTRPGLEGLQGVDVDVSTMAGHIILKNGISETLMTPSQAAALMKNLRRAIVETDPKALRE